MDCDPQIRGWRAAARMHHQYLTGLLLYLLQKEGEPAATEFIFQTFRRQHLESSCPGSRLWAWQPCRPP